MEDERYAYVTVVTNERYIEGCLVLYESLNIVESEHPFYVLMPTNIESEVVQKLKRRRINCIFSDSHYHKYISADTRRLYWRDTVFKLEIFSLVQFDKIVFLDADMIVLKNIDSLFLKPHMSAVIAGKSLHPNWANLGSGLMVIKPNLKEYEGLLTHIERTYQARSELGYGFGDQDVIKAYYREWPMIDSLHLDETYNVMLGYAGPMKRAKLIDSYDDIFVYHFTGKQKPWSNHFTDWIAIFLKIIKRKGCAIDFQILRYYRKCFMTIRKNQELV